MELFNIINLIANIIILSMLILVFSKSENLFTNNTRKNDLYKIDDSNASESEVKSNILLNEKKNLELKVVPTPTKPKRTYKRKQK